MSIGFSAGRVGQRGVVLLVSLMMLLLVTLMVVSGFNLTQTNLKVVHNLENRTLTKEAANAALDEAISSNRFLDGGALFASSCERTNQKCYDLNADGVNDVTVLVELACTIATPISNDGVGALAGVEQGSNSEESAFALPDSPWTSCLSSGGGSAPSRCSDVVWNFMATATDIQTGAQFQVRQGLATPADNNDVSRICD